MSYHPIPTPISLSIRISPQNLKVPFDKGRLVFPPVPAAMLVLLFRSIFHATSGFYIGEALMAGGIFG